MPNLRYDFYRDAYYLDYGQAGRDIITEKHAKSLVANNKVLVACEIPRSWKRFAAQQPRKLHAAFGL